MYLMYEVPDFVSGMQRGLSAGSPNGPKRSSVLLPSTTDLLGSGTNRGASRCIAMVLRLRDAVAVRRQTLR